MSLGSKWKGHAPASGNDFGAGSIGEVSVYMGKLFELSPETFFQRPFDF